MTYDLLLIAGGLVGLFAGGEALVRGSVGLAQRLGLSPMLIGLTVVGFGTSMPELLVSLDAALRGVPEIAIGNIVGSNIANILLIVGLAALVWPIRLEGPAPRRDLLTMLVAAVVLLPIFAWGMVSRPMGAAMLAGLGLYLWLAFRDPDGKVEVELGVEPPPVLGALLRLALGLVGLVIGARLLVDGAVSLARGAGLSEAFIGLSIVAVGTSLPELATSLVAALRRQSAIAIGNVVGSNIFNVLGILGATALISPVPVADRFLGFDWPVMLAASLALVGLLVLRPAIGRPAGVLLLVAYAAYLWVGQG